jgi:hypothetical protein
VPTKSVVDTLFDTVWHGRARLPADEYHVELSTLSTGWPFVNTTERDGDELENR